MARPDVVHLDVVEANVFYRTAAAALALDIDAALRPLAHHVAHHHVADSARSLAPHHHAARPAMHHDVRDGHVFRGPVDAQTVGVFFGLKRDGVVAVIEIAVGNPHVAAGIDINAAGKRAGKSLEGDVPNRDVLRVQHVHRPERGADHVNAFDHNIPALRQANERRAQEGSDFQILGFGARRLLLQVRQHLVPVGTERGTRAGIAARRGAAHQFDPLGIICGDDAAARYGDVLQIVPADQRHWPDGLDALRSAFGVRQASRREAQRGAGFDVQDQIADQFDGPADVLPGGDKNRAAARRMSSLDRLAYASVAGVEPSPRAP